MAKIYQIIFITLLFSNHFLKAQDSTKTNFFKPILEEFEQIKRQEKLESTVSVAGFSAKTLRESAGIVSLITGEEIQNSGAKNLIDVLRNVPSFDIALDIAPILTVRGNAGAEAKMLLLINGQQINDASVGFASFMQRFPLQNIDKIEIIRGSGSVIYGAMASLAVINIITKKAKNDFDASANVTTGIAYGGIIRNNVEVWTAGKINKKLEFTLSASSMTGKLTNTDHVGGLYNKAVENNKYSYSQAECLILGIRYKKFELQYFINSNNNRFPQFGDAKTSDFLNSLTASYRFDIDSKFKIYSKIVLREQTPSAMYDVPDLPDFYGLTTKKFANIGFTNTLDRRYLLNVYGIYQASNRLQFVFGTESFVDQSAYRNDLLFQNGTKKINLANFGAFAEASFSSDFANITLGARLDQYANIEPVFAPRLAITKTFDKFHVKLLYSEGFKNPTIQNIALAKDKILPEKSRTFEFELGWQASENLRITANIYDMHSQNFIARKDNLIEGIGLAYAYANIGNLGTQGIEAEGQWKQKWGQISFAYSFYRVSQNNEELRLAQVSKVFPAIPAQKASLQGYFKINPQWSVSPNLVYLTNKFSFANNNVSTEFPAELQVNFYTEYKHFLAQNLSVGLGCFNVLDGKYWLLSWRKDLSSSINLPWQGREFYLKISYNFR
ncbi:MAG: TonB-dependent receptor [Bacteroidetes bacterium]|nr:MAG: TonB-dependent receptor [Bacteroidota bacterium]